MADGRRFFLFGAPLSPLYSLAMRIRAWCYAHGIFERAKLAAFVISVGNLTMGGTGKTPMVIYLARLLRNWRPAVVSRGYGGSARAPVNVVSTGADILLAADQAGDEPRMMAESLPGVPVITGVKRKIAGRYAIDHFGAKAVILDDGFQHLAVQRNLDLVLFNSLAPLGNGRVFPGGNLREPLQALGRADGFVITGVDEATGAAAEEFASNLARIHPATPVFFGRNLPVGLVDTSGGRFAMDLLGENQWFAFCGLGNPHSFRSLLEGQNIALAGFSAYRDHHSYTSEDLRMVVEQAAASGARGILTTTKDLVKLRHIATDIPALDDQVLPLYAVELELRMAAGFDDFVLRHLSGKM